MCFTMVLVDNWGRRPLTVYGYMITTLADFGMGAVGMYDVAGSEKLGSLLVFFACLATFTTTSSSAIGYAYLSEIPKQDFRAKSAGWGLAFPNFFSIMVRTCLHSTSARAPADPSVLLCHPLHAQGYYHWLPWMGCQDRLLFR
jgi:hypothetical protein